MQYHALSFAKEGFTVDIIGYPGSIPLREIRENPCIHIYYLYPFPKIENSMCLISLLWEFYNLFYLKHNINVYIFYFMYKLKIVNYKLFFLK